MRALPIGMRRRANRPTTRKPVARIAVATRKPVARIAVAVGAAT